MECLKTERAREAASEDQTFSGALRDFDVPETRGQAADAMITLAIHSKNLTLASWASKWVSEHYDIEINRYREPKHAAQG